MPENPTPNTPPAASQQNPDIDQVFTSWRQEFLNLPPEAQQTALFNMMCDRLYWRIIYYARRYPEKLVSSSHTYSDRCVSFEEFKAYMGHIEEDGYAAKWLESNRVPTIEVARDRISLLESQLHVLLELDANCPILKIKRNFALSDLEMSILATLAIAMSVESLLRLMTVAWADFSVRQPTVSFICQLLSDSPRGFDSVYSAFSEQGTLRRMRLIIPERSATLPNYTPLMYAPLSIEQTVIDAFKGRSAARELPPNMTLHRDHLPMRSLIIEDNIREEFAYALKSPAARICLAGPVHAGRRTAACTFAHKAKFSGVLEVDMTSEFDPKSPTMFEARLSSIMRESLFEGSLLMLRFDDIDDKTELMQHITHAQVTLSRITANFPGSIVLLVNKANAALSDAFGKPVCIHIQPPHVELAANVWHRALAPWASPDEIEHMADMFSRNYSLPVGSIFAVVRDAVDALQSTGADPSTLQSHHILNEIRKSFRHQLGSLAEITVSDVPISGVVLPPAAKAQVNEILQYAKNLHNVLDVWGFRQRSPYGNALSVLFAGPPGTGKTLLACALANELGKVLYRVDLSRIVDKYIGETEKNLGRIFDEAAKAQAIILFDEADSLFAKRTDVKTSNDRYANLEINYLLQKLESYNGITILTTNLSKSIDEAFRRRLRFIIDFPMPDVPARIELWKRMIPPNAPLSDDIHWTWLAHTFEMSGGYIRNAVLKAAITASATNTPISMAHLAKAAADEARSMGMLLRIDEAYDAYDYDDDEDQ
ncbi:MAG: ATP-binding protein [Proteobacteria bacterium]|nr:ATP-binding protein [Pseudomonadota bacterium]